MILASRTLFLICIICGCLCLGGYAQRSYNYYYVRNTVFAEGATLGPLYSVNFDRIFRFGEELNYSYRIGLSYWEKRFAGSLGLCVFAGEGPHHPEMSLIIQPSTRISVKELSVSDIQSNFTGTIGYRYQRLDLAGLFIKAGFGMMFMVDPPLENIKDALRPKYVGLLGLGYCF